MFRLLVHFLVHIMKPVANTLASSWVFLLYEKCSTNIWWDDHAHISSFLWYWCVTFGYMPSSMFSCKYEFNLCRPLSPKRIESLCMMERHDICSLPFGVRPCFTVRNPRACIFLHQHPWFIASDGLYWFHSDAGFVCLHTHICSEPMMDALC